MRFLEVFAASLLCATAQAANSSNRSTNLHAPIPIPFTLNERGFVTLVIEDAAGHRVRNLVSETEFPAGNNTVYWDGLNDLARDPASAADAVYHIPGRLARPGAYRVRGLVRPRLELRYEFTVYNHGKPPWRSKNNSSEWLANHSPPSAVLFVPREFAPRRDGRAAPGGQIIVSSHVSEGGSGVAWLDLRGNKLHGQLWIGGVWTGATQLTRDEGDDPVPGVYAYTGAAWEGELRLHQLGAPTNRSDAPADPRFGFGEDRRVLRPVWRFPEGRFSKQDTSKHGLGGLAARNGLLVASLPLLDQLLFIDARQRKVIGAAPLEAPRGVAFTASGDLLAISKTKVLRMEHEAIESLRQTETTDGSKLSTVALPRTRILVETALEDPRQLALDSRGRLYISDWGGSHQVKVFGADGSFLRAIGDAGKPKAGPYNPRHMNHPLGITIDGQDRLWVAERDDGPKRVSVWSLDGRLENAFYGPPQYGGGGEIDAYDKSLFHYGAERAGITFKLDWEKRSFAVQDVYFREDDDRSRLPLGTFVNLAPQTPIQLRGRKYMTSVFNTHPTGGPAVASIWSLENGVAVARAALGSASEWKPLTNEFKTRVPAGMTPSEAMFVWSDSNGNGVADASEITVSKGSIGSGVTITRDLAIVTARGQRFAPVSFTREGAPIYDARQAETLFTEAQTPASSGGGEVIVGEEGWIVCTTPPRPLAAHSVGGVRKGVPMWSYPSLWPGLHASHNAPVPERPGELIGTTRVIGFPVSPRGSDAGELWAINGNKGNVYLFTMDGLFVATLFRDSRQASWNFIEDTPGLLVNDASLHEESFWSMLTQTSDGNIYLTSHNACIVRIDGLEQIRRLPESKLAITRPMLAAARDYFVQSEARRQAERNDTNTALVITLRQTAPVVDGNLEDWPTNGWVTIDTRTRQVGDWGHKKLKTEAALAVADGKLFAAFKTWDANLLSNGGASLPFIFKSGGALDLMLDAVEGGERLLVTQVGGRTTAVLYRPQAVGGRKEPVEFASPLRSIKFDRVDDVTGDVKLAAGAEGVFEFSVSLATLGLDARRGEAIRGDVGVLRGDGRQTWQRSYWSNKSAGLVSDIPSEAELQPDLWGRMEFR